MNDFTKDELDYIRDYIFNGAASIRFDNHESLKNKLQSMIDNYCEHYGEIGKDYPGEKCMKCNRMWE